jgi:hypothetical protein
MMLMLAIVMIRPWTFLLIIFYTLLYLWYVITIMILTSWFSIAHQNSDVLYQNSHSLPPPLHLLLPTHLKVNSLYYLHPKSLMMTVALLSAILIPSDALVWSHSKWPLAILISLQDPNLCWWHQHHQHLHQCP